MGAPVGARLPLVGLPYFVIPDLKDSGFRDEHLVSLHGLRGLGALDLSGNDAIAASGLRALLHTWTSSCSCSWSELMSFSVVEPEGFLACRSAGQLGAHAGVR